VKIAIVNTMAPYIYGGAEFFADSLRDKFIEFGHQAQVIRFHYSWYPLDNILDGMLAARMTRLVNCDRMIGMKFPSYLIGHPNKRLWLVHQLRQAYDLAGTEYDMFADTPHDQQIKRAVIQADNKYLRELEGHIFTNSPVVSERLWTYNQIKSAVLYPPLMDASLFSFGDYGDYIFYPSRVNRSKRQHLAVEAMRYVKSGVKLVIAGKGDSEEDERFLFQQIEENGVKDRVTYLNRFISQEEKAELFKNCLAGIYIPYDEDSYGYVTLEGFQSGKAVISCTDAGGTYVVVQDGETGFMTEPAPQALAEAMDKLYNNRRLAKEMGRNGLPLLEKLGITWENVVRRLTE
jgi:glycosyltransferase involved in cell wall biosynthesis